MVSHLLLAVTIVAVETARAAIAGGRWMWARLPRTRRAFDTAGPVLGMPNVPVDQALAAAAAVFVMWACLGGTLNMGRAVGSRYLQVAWQVPEGDAPVWTGRAGPFRWETTGQIVCRWGTALWEPTQRASSLAVA